MRIHLAWLVKCDRCNNEATVHEVMVKSSKRQEKHLCEACAREQGLPSHPVLPSVTDVLADYMHQSIVGPIPAPPSGASPSPVSDQPAEGPLALPGKIPLPKPTSPTAIPSADSGGPPALPSPPAPVVPTASTCGSCGTTFAQFRATGLLGCPECYRIFEVQLGSLLARAHEGGTHHAGKVPSSKSTPGALAGSGKGASDGPGGRMRQPDLVASASPDVSAMLEAQIAERIKLLRRRLEEAIASEQYERAAKLRDEITRVAARGAPGQDNESLPERTELEGTEGPGGPGGPGGSGGPVGGGGAQKR